MANILVIQVQDFLIESYLPLLIVLVPIIGSFFTGLSGLKSLHACRAMALLTAATALYLTVELFLTVQSGYTVTYDLPALAGISIGFRVDLLGSVFALFTAIIWFIAVAASLPYMAHDKRQNRYFTFLILSLGGCIGVFLCGDFLSLFLFFELMTLAAYALVVHTQTGDALKAGANYLYLGVVGGLALLSGIILLKNNIGTVSIEPLLQSVVLTGSTAALIAVLMIAGFGVKAGMIPLHIWLPQAHPVAPAPASALLSGIMIKTGAYGIIRVVTMLYTPGQDYAESALWHYTANFGHVIIWMGIMTMLLAALMAVLQNNAKRLLAYSSISQMGYILMGIGAAGYLGYDGAMGFGGFTYHIINHAFFKSGLFILFGIVYTRLHEVNMGNLGGLWRKFPLTFVAFLVCAFGITGIPGFNGYVSKTLLHHAIVEAFEHHHLWDLWTAEKLFMLTSGLTVCYITKLVITVFLGKIKPETNKKLSGKGQGEGWIERAVALSFIGAIVFLGLFPDLMIKKVIVPMSATFTYNDYYVNYLLKTNVWNIHDLTGIAIAFFIGAGIYLVALKKDLFLVKPPDYLSVEYSVYMPVTRILGISFTRFGRLVDDNVNRGFHGAPSLLVRAAGGAGYFDSRLLNSFGERFINIFSVLFNAIYTSWINMIKMLFGRIAIFLKKVFMAMFKFDYSTKGDQRFQTFNISNIDFDLYIVLFVIGLILATSLLVLL
ncbi:MAG: proton-conducting transporter membrane subunit [Bacillota bacterium]|nr:proton-conducting transporter membrane subunit [Bacillota bacterium]